MSEEDAPVEQVINEEVDALQTAAVLQTDPTSAVPYIRPCLCVTVQDLEEKHTLPL